ncbi:MAG: VOC family protein [Chloroflexi bacterium]|nr:VOC family protein [Chloroflexota bacterium]
MTAEKPRFKLPPPHHIGIVVDDMERAIRYYGSVFGWGPFQVREVDMGVLHLTWRGQPARGRFKAAVGQSGPMAIELFQVLEGQTPYTEFHAKKGEGIHHLGFKVDDVNRAIAALAEEGIKPVFQGRFGTGAFAYFDTDKIGGTVFELLDYWPSG